MERFAKISAAALKAALGTEVGLTELENPPDPALGDFAFPCFKLSKQFKKAPPLIAKELAEKIAALGILPPSNDLSVSSAGPYVNFTVAPGAAARAIVGDVLAGGYGRLAPGSRGTWVLEFSSPNVAKPFQIYHLRPTALGAALDRIGRFRGFSVVSINHLGDWGTQYGKLAVAFRMFGSSLPPEPTIRDLVDIYVRFHSEAEKNPALEDEARDAFLRLERDDPAMTVLWRRCVDISMKEFNRIYGRIGVKFDKFWGESHYKNMLQPLLDRLRSDGLLVESEGAWIVSVSDAAGKELPPCILQKKDGATIYATRDVAAALFRYEQFKFDRMTYIVGAEQKLHFQQVFGVLKRMGCDWHSRCEHVPTGLYRFKDAKMSTRSGNYIIFEDVLQLARDRVTSLMKERAVAPDDAITEAVAVGAVVFHDLHTDPARDVEFDLERVVDFEGETGPYLQYAHTRCLGILRKAGAQLAPNWSTELAAHLSAPEEIQLIKTLGQFPLHLERTLTFAKASQLAHYLIDVTKLFGAFYRECHVLGDNPELTRARLCLVDATRSVLASGLGLLGIPLPERM